MTKKGIIPIMSGGLGNQMFIMASAYVVSIVSNYPLYILKNTLDNNKHNIHKYDYNKTIFKYFGIAINLEYTKLKEHIDFKDYIYHSHNFSNGFDAWDPYKVEEGTIMMSYYQYYPSLQNFENEIRFNFLKGLSHINLNEDIKENDAFLHVRRGDYLEHQNIHFIQPISYYYECVEQLLKMNDNVSKIHVLSDDIEWIKERKLFKGNIFHIVENLDELQTMLLMSLCKGGAICSNSTFCWWGAFLGTYEKRNPVFVPKKWISVKDDISNLFPSEWIII
jgi:hypothetical protein